MGYASHHDFLFRRAEIEKDRLACLSKVRRTPVAAKDASLAALEDRSRSHSRYQALFVYHKGTRDWGMVGTNLWVSA